MKSQLWNSHSGRTIDRKIPIIARIFFSPNNNEKATMYYYILNEVFYAVGF